MKIQSQDSPSVTQQKIDSVTQDTLEQFARSILREKVSKSTAHAAAWQIYFALRDWANKELE